MKICLTIKLWMMKNWTIKDYQKDTVSIDLFFFLQKVEPGQRGMCCRDISNLCISNSWAGEQSLKNRSGKFKKNRSSKCNQILRSFGRSPSCGWTYTTITGIKAAAAQPLLHVANPNGNLEGLLPSWGGHLCMVRVQRVITNCSFCWKC